ncbi:selenide,water dikinase [Desulfomicrobium macestii]|uniref:Selenide, water dikinase n=2 Tax=Desulfomicrobium TaxID=898 RepID=A0A8G2F5I3_DESNO|nr:selenide,water dikinase [Desulfomicrobium macestii]SFL55344.1 selenide, water dikinase [Desulfomicrobium norvegicum]
MLGLNFESDERILAGMGNSEDAAIVRFPDGKALVQTLDFFTPIVNDPFRFGQIAAANSLSDVYAMGGVPYVAMNIVCFPIATMDVSILREILRGGLLKVQEAGAMLVGGHSVQDKEIKYGLSVSGFVDPDRYATNAGLRPGDVLILTKPIGTGVLATAIKGNWEGCDGFEDDVYRWASRLNRVPGEAVARFRLKAATDITGFGLGGHALEMATASDCSISIDVSSVPIMDHALDLARVGLLPLGSHANKHFCHKTVEASSALDPVLLDLMYDAQTSGGMLLGVPPELLGDVRAWLRDGGEMAAEIGVVEPPRGDGKRLLLC